MDNAHRGVLVGEGAMRRGHVRLSRRDFFLGAGGTAVGVAGITGVGTVSAQVHKHALFHEAYVAAVLGTRTSPPPVQPCPAARSSSANAPVPQSSEKVDPALTDLSPPLRPRYTFLNCDCPSRCSAIRRTVSRSGYERRIVP
jgi:hypothetical protein